mmetsp:Transcript_10297/g.18581  ORF Transcript_10297/g.18581 Transcript_10297/m.18581 type:complete len:151 (+) Transcript_10297:642-1094(+)
MDQEHEKCEEALSLLLHTPSVQSLTNVMEMLTEHFQSKETLMKHCGCGSPGEPFSPYANHVKDHERILEIGYVELARKVEPNNSFLAMTCSDTQLKEPHKSFLAMTCSNVQENGASTYHTPAMDIVMVDKSVAENIVREFRLHATRSDML